MQEQINSQAEEIEELRSSPCTGREISDEVVNFDPFERFRSPTS
jgi:hypothetical protein